MSEPIERFTLRDPYGTYGEYVLASDYDRLAKRKEELERSLATILSKFEGRTFSGPGPANRPITHYLARNLSPQDYEAAFALVTGVE